MNCRQAQEEMLEGKASPAGDAHVAECAECGRFQASQRMLGAWAPQEPPLGLVERTMRGIQEAPAREFWIDRWIRLFGEWLQRRHPMTAASMAGALLVLVLAPNWVRSRAQGELTGCQTNLRTLSIAMEDYARANQGKYPASLQQLGLQTQPACPSAGTFTYAAEVAPHAYTLYCAGHHHQRENFPQYSSLSGPLDGYKR